MKSTRGERIDWATLGHDTVPRPPHHPLGRRRDHRRRRPPLTRGRAAARLRRRPHPRRPRHRRPGPRRGPHQPARHPRPVDRARVPRPTLRVPRLHEATRDVPRPPHHPLGRRRQNRPGQPGHALRPAPPDHPRHPPGRSASTPPTADPSSSPHPNAASNSCGSETDPGGSEHNSEHRTVDPSQPVTADRRHLPGGLDTPPRPSAAPRPPKQRLLHRRLVPGRPGLEAALEMRVGGEEEPVALVAGDDAFRPARASRTRWGEVEPPSGRSKHSAP